MRCSEGGDSSLTRGGCGTPAWGPRSLSLQLTCIASLGTPELRLHRGSLHTSHARMAGSSRYLTPVCARPSDQHAAQTTRLESWPQPMALIPISPPPWIGVWQWGGSYRQCAPQRWSTKFQKPCSHIGSASPVRVLTRRSTALQKASNMAWHLGSVKRRAHLPSGVHAANNTPLLCMAYS